MSKRDKLTGRRPIVLTMRGSRAWRDWLNGLASRERRPASMVVELALKARAEASGYKPMPGRGGPEGGE